MLEAAAYRWLTLERQCAVVLHERTPRYLWGSRPDALGITKARYLIEVEIKRSVSDFKNNEKKPHVKHRDRYLKAWPKEFYYFVPERIADQCLEILPEWAGLAKQVGDWQFVVLKDSPVNLLSARLSIKECWSAFHLLSNQMHSRAFLPVVNWQCKQQADAVHEWWSPEI